MSPPLQLISNNLEDTMAIGRRLGRLARSNDVIALTGILGAGKTHLAKGIAAGLGVEDLRTVNSPTFVIINEYQGRLHMYHVDAYRLVSSIELQALGFEEMCSAGGLVTLEWADKVANLLPADHLGIMLAVSGPTQRKFSLRAGGPQSADLLARLTEVGDA